MVKYADHFRKCMGMKIHLLMLMMAEYVLVSSTGTDRDGPLKGKSRQDRYCVRNAGDRQQMCSVSESDSGCARVATAETGLGFKKTLLEKFRSEESGLSVLPQAKKNMTHKKCHDDPVSSEGASCTSELQNETMEIDDNNEIRMSQLAVDSKSARTDTCKHSRSTYSLYLYMLNKFDGFNVKCTSAQYCEDGTQNVSISKDEIAIAFCNSAEGHAGHDREEKTQSGVSLHQSTSADCSFGRICSHISKIGSKILRRAHQDSNCQSQSIITLFENVEDVLVFDLMRSFNYTKNRTAKELSRQKNMLIEVLSLHYYNSTTSVFFKSLFVYQLHMFVNYDITNKLVIFPELQCFVDHFYQIGEDGLRYTYKNMVMSFYMMRKFEYFKEAITMEYLFEINEHLRKDEVVCEGVCTGRKTNETGICGDGESNMQDKHINPLVLEDIPGECCSPEPDKAVSAQSNDGKDMQHRELHNKSPKVRENDGNRRYYIQFVTKNQNLLKFFVRKFILLFLIHAFIQDEDIMLKYFWLTYINFQHFDTKRTYRILFEIPSDNFYDFVFHNLIETVPLLDDDTLVKLIKPESDEYKNGSVHQNVYVSLRGSQHGSLSFEDRMRQVRLSRMLVYNDASGHDLLIYSSSFM